MSTMGGSSTGVAVLQTLGATKSQIEIFKKRLFKGQLLSVRWAEQKLQKRITAVVEALTRHLSPPFNAVDAILAKPALVETTAIDRIVHNIQQLRELREDVWLDLIIARPELLMHPESEFRVDEIWVDCSGATRSGGTKSKRKAAQQVPREIKKRRIGNNDTIRNSNNNSNSSTNNNNTSPKASTQ
eukprot:TRINITY_DN7499_c4_g1_i1.p1 TRINITY_DN7499_c4_g1~~TRINITY_DN7499_c4_g1_i1.p1  ORF type:complete len:186 (-),score=30.42 TRINITY_DN7499_c4_g1_i1:227-784(-)